ncbi:hypothetical protein JXL19_01590 [bacterium]|nr:hypothetical protein [bacterium]
MEKERFEILLEDIDKKLDIVVEGHQVLDKKIEDYRKEFIQELKNTNDLMRSMHNSLDKKIDQTAEGLDKKIDQTAEKLENKLDQVDKKIEMTKIELKEDIKRVEKKLDIITDGYQNHDERITNLERAIHN